jgi:hypothetical protein
MINVRYNTKVTNIFHPNTFLCEDSEKSFF